MTNGKYNEPFLRGENDEHPNDLPKGKEKAKYQSDKSKIYKDIDELIEKLIQDDANFKSSKASKPPTSTTQSYKPKTSVTPTSNLNLNMNNGSFSYNKKLNGSINNNDIFKKTSSINKDDRSQHIDLSTSRFINKKDNIKKSESFSRSESIKTTPIHHSIHSTTPTAPFPSVKTKPLFETINPIKDNDIPVNENKKVEENPVQATTVNKDDTLVEMEQTVLQNITLRSKDKLKKSESNRKRSSEKSSRNHHGHNSHHHRHRSSSAKSNSRRSKNLQVIHNLNTS